jgi:hypothetical protein
MIFTRNDKKKIFLTGEMIEDGLTQEIYGVNGFYLTAMVSISTLAPNGSLTT